MSNLNLTKIIVLTFTNRNMEYIKKVLTIHPENKQIDPVCELYTQTQPVSTTLYPEGGVQGYRLHGPPYTGMCYGFREWDRQRNRAGN